MARDWRVEDADTLGRGLRRGQRRAHRRETKRLERELIENDGISISERQEIDEEIETLTRAEQSEISNIFDDYEGK